MFDYRAFYESQPSVSVDLLRVVQFSGGIYTTPHKTVPHFVRLSASLNHKTNLLLFSCNVSVKMACISHHNATRFLFCNMFSVIAHQFEIKYGQNIQTFGFRFLEAYNIIM